VGYRQPSHFVKAFRRRFGVTPGAFRDAARRQTAVDAVALQAGRPRPQSSRGAGPTARGYSNPNSVDALRPDAPGDGRAEDGVAGAACAPALAARADRLDDEDDAGGEWVVPPPPSKPNSPLA
jgi:hypothetical protein